MTKRLRQQRASVLILAIWTLMLLTVLATAIGLKVRGRMGILSTIEERSRHHFLAEAGVKKAIAALRFDNKRYPQGLDGASKEYRYNNPEQFRAITLGEDQTSVSYQTASQGQEDETYYGVIDEERKINVNTTDAITLVRLMAQLTGRPEEELAAIAGDIINWRELRATEIVGFASDEYYATLPQPYPVKHAPFELYDELRLIRGIDDELFEKMRPFVTVYGDGLVNINTAPREVIVALGLTPELTDKFLEARRGLDGKDSTDDDHIFRTAHDVTREVEQIVTLIKDEIIAIDFLNASGKIKVDSSLYAISSTANLRGVKAPLTVHCVYNVHDNVIEYWRENI